MSTQRLLAPVIATAALVAITASSTAASAIPPAARFPRTPRPIHAARAAVTPSASVAAGGRSAAALLQSFDGTSSSDSARTNFGAEFEPPDQGLCVGNGFVLEPVNSAYRVFRTDGTRVSRAINVNAIFHRGFKQFTSDPRCHFDEATHTWFAVILFLNDDFTASTLDIAVNHRRNPTRGWTRVSIGTTDVGGRGCPCFGDQPLLGIDGQNLYVSTNEFSIKGPQFNGAQLYIVRKHDLVAGRRPFRFVHVAVKLRGALIGSVQPAVTQTPSRAEFLMASIDRGHGGHRIAVWAITDRDAVVRGAVPTISLAVVRSERYANPPPARQRGSSKRLDSGDDRMQQTESVGGTVWGELGTVAHVAGRKRAAAAWFQVRPRLRQGRIASARIVRQGYVAARDSVLYPAIAADAAGAAAMVFTMTGSDRFPSAAYTTLAPGANQFLRPTIAAAGTGPYFRKSTRWGDYSWAVLHPTDSRRAWLATEYIPARRRQTPDRHQNWGTRVLEVRLPR